MVSICMATYNGEKYIEEQLLSILNQTKKADEVIICDDRSSDNTASIIANFIEKNKLYPSWKLFVNKMNEGYPRNFYNCIEKCEGDILFFSDQDDIWGKDKIEKMEYVLIKNPQIQILSCNHGLIDSEGKSINGYMAPKKSETMAISSVNIKEILYEYHWPGMTMAIRREFYKEISSMIKNSNIPHDFILAIFASSVQGFYYYDYIGTYHRRHEKNTAREEHRIFKILDLKRKLHEIQVYYNMLQIIFESKFPFIAQVNEEIISKLELSRMRIEVLKNRNYIDLFRLYFSNRDKLRFKSFICDFWLLCFGNYKQFIENH